MREKLKIIDRDLIKFIAIIPMAAGHFVGYLSDGKLYRDMSALEFITMFAALFAPIVFFFFIGEGFRYTQSRKKYAARLLIFAAVNQIPYCLLENGTLLTTELFLSWNIFFTLFLGLICIGIWEKEWKMAKRIAVIAGIDVLTLFICGDWALFGIPIMVLYHVFRDRPKLRDNVMIPVLLCISVVCAIGVSGIGEMTGRIFLLIGASFMAAYFIVTRLYNGKKGLFPTFSKWFFYIFYPLHLAVIYVIRMAAG